MWMGLYPDEVQRFVDRINEFSLELMRAQIKAAGGLYDYAAKYGSQPAEKLCPAPITDELAERLRTSALIVHKTIGARHLSRTDFIVDLSGEIWFLEINTIPGLSVLFPRAVAASGRDFGQLLARWIEETA